jgi:hypothetical protein
MIGHLLDIILDLIFMVMVLTLAILATVILGL